MLSRTGSTPAGVVAGIWIVLLLIVIGAPWTATALIAAGTALGWLLWHRPAWPGRPAGSER